MPWQPSSQVVLSSQSFTPPKQTSPLQRCLCHCIPLPLTASCRFQGRVLFSHFSSSSLYQESHIASLAQLWFSLLGCEAFTLYMVQGLIWGTAISRRGWICRVCSISKCRGKLKLVHTASWQHPDLLCCLLFLLTFFKLSSLFLWSPGSWRSCVLFDFA